MAATDQTLREMYDAMLARLGRQQWWPAAAGAGTAEGKLEICVGAILTQNTNWGNVERAIENLRTAGRLSVAAIDAMGHDELAELIRPAGYFNVKAKRLKNFIRAVADAGGDIEAFLDRPVYELREALLAVSGVGRETADSMALYAAGLATFVVDTYTHRILLRHGLIDEDADYEQIKELFESALPADVAMFNEYHALLVAVGKNYCRKRGPVCDDCPLNTFDHDPQN